MYDFGIAAHQHEKEQVISQMKYIGFRIWACEQDDGFLNRFFAKVWKKRLKKWESLYARMIKQ